MILAEIILTTETIIFVGTVVFAVISIMFFVGAIDKRLTVLEANTIKKEEFYSKIDELKDSIVGSVQKEIRNCKIMNHTGSTLNED